MRTRPLSGTLGDRSPAGAEIRYLMKGATGNMIHSTVPPGQVNQATADATVSEFGHVLSCRGEIPSRDESGEEGAVLEPDVSIDTPVGTARQHRSAGVEPLRVLRIAMQLRPRRAEASLFDGPRTPTTPNP